MNETKENVWMDEPEPCIYLSRYRAKSGKGSLFLATGYRVQTVHGYNESSYLNA